MKKWLAVFLFQYILPAAAQPAIDVQHYRFEIELSDKTDAITGKATISIRFLEDMPAFQLDLVSVKDDKGMYAFLVKEGPQMLTSRHVADRLYITLVRPAKKGEQRQFEIQYMGTPDDGLIISKNKYGDRTFFSDNWPNRAHYWLPCNDTPADKASVSFTVTAPAHYKVISNGILVAETVEGDKRKTVWEETVPLPTKIMVIGVARFAVKEYTTKKDSVPVSAWVYPQDSTKGFYDYGLAPSILDFFSRYIAPYPFKKLANVQSKTIFGGMENASAIFYAENSVTGDRKSEDLIAHEIAHQWFGNTATEESFAHLWLSEGFATYLTNVYLEYKYGPDTLRKRMAADREQVISFARTSPNAVVDSSAALMDLLNANSYQKGSWVLHMLRQQTGDSIFRNIIREYYREYKNGNADSRDFEAVAEKVYGSELTPFFNNWLYKGGVPELKIEMAKGEELQLKITQLKGIYEFPLQVVIELENGEKINETVIVRDKENVFTRKGLPRNYKVLIDPEVKTLFKEVK